MGLTADLKKWYIKTIPGMNNKVEDLDLQNRWVEVAQNCRFEEEPGAVDKRDPVTYFNDTSTGTGPVTGLYRFYTSTGSTVWVKTHGTKAYVGNDTTGTFSQIRASLTSSKRHSFVVYKDLLIGGNGYDNLWVYDGASDNVTWELGSCKAIASTAAGSITSSSSYYYAVTIGTADQYVCGAISNTVVGPGSAQYGGADNDSFAKLSLHCNGIDASTTFTDSEATPKTATANGNAQISTYSPKFGTGAGLWNGAGNDTYVKLLLHGDGVDASTTITDSSSSPKTMTAGNSAQIDTAIKKFGTGAILLSRATADYVSTPDHADFALGTGDFSFDTWIYFNDTSSNQYIFIQRDDTNNYCGLLMNAGTVFGFSAASAGVVLADYSAAVSLSAGTWYHFAMSRSGTNFYMFLNGQLLNLTVNTAIASNSLPDLTTTFCIGARFTPTPGGASMDGSLDEFRWSKGVCRWTKTFVPPLKAYGAGDYVSLLDSADWNYGSGDFTIEGWVYAFNTGGPVDMAIYSQDDGADTNKVVIYIKNDGSVRFHVISSSVAIADYTSSTNTITVGVWIHLAIVRSGTSLKIYKNGTDVTTTTTTAIASGTLPDIAQPLEIGRRSISSGSNYYEGMMDEYRISKGTARWTADFTPSTIEYTNSNSGSVNLSNIPLGPVGTGARKIYRTVGDGSTLKLLATIANNTATVYTDTIADGSLGATMPSVTDDMPKGSMLQIHRERLFVSGDPSNQSYIYYSNPYLPGYIQQTNGPDYMRISPEDGDVIMGIPIQLGVMVCVKKNTIRKLHITSPVSGADPSTWYADDPIAWVGSPAQWSICQTPDGIIFLGWDHWYKFDGASAQPIFDEFDTQDILDGNYNDVVSYYHNGIFLSAYTDKVTGGQVHNRIMRYNFKRQALSYDIWTSDTMTGANCFAGRMGDGEPGDLYYGDSANGYVVKDKDVQNEYRLRTKTDANLGSTANVFVGGTENSPYLELGGIVSASSIPDNVCIFWDNDTTTPGTGWTEITSTYEGKAIKISTTSLTTSAGTSHTHTLTGSIPLWSGSVVNYGDGNPGAVSAHSHEVSSASDASTPLPRHINYRIFKKNSSTTEYEFPDGAIIMYDQAAAPDGWQAQSSVGYDGYYAALSTTGLNQVNPGTHTHTFNIPTGTAAGSLAQSDSGTNGPAFGHNHTIVGTLATADLATWELDYVSFNFIKKTGESDSWDGVNRYAYCLFATTGTSSNGWTEDTTYNGKFLKIGSSLPSTGAAANFGHTHVGGTFTTSTESARWGNGGYHATGYAGPHTHQVTLNSASGSVSNPPSVTFRLFKKILGQMKPYNNASTTTYTSGTWESAAAQIKAESLGSIYWNEQITGNDNIIFKMRSGATEAACLAASYGTDLTNPNGSIIDTTANIWVQYIISFTAADSTVSNPRVYFTNGFAVKYTYHKGATNAETSVNFQYSVGFRNFDEPIMDKVFKKIATKHVGTQGSFALNWLTENSSDSFTISLANFPAYWDSYFQSTAMGREIDVEIVKNDLYPFRISEIEGLYSPYQYII